MRPLFLIFVLLSSVSAEAFAARDPMYAQVLFGQLQLDDSTVSVSDASSKYTGEVHDIPYLGAAAQVPLKDDVFGYGWEAGGFFSWINERVDYYGRSDENGAQVKISIDNSFWAFETFMGVYASFKPVDRLRLYVSGGPLLIYGVAENDDSGRPSVMPVSGGTVAIDLSGYDTDISTGYYGRAGFDLLLADNFWAGFCVRYMHTNLDLDDSLGNFAIDGNLYLFSLTQKL